MLIKGGLILIRTLAKVSAYAVTSSYAASLGTIAMAAYSLTFNLGFATSQLCGKCLCRYVYVYVYMYINHPINWFIYTYLNYSI